MSEVRTEMLGAASVVDLEGFVTAGGEAIGPGASLELVGLWSLLLSNAGAGNWGAVASVAAVAACGAGGGATARAAARAADGAGMALAVRESGTVETWRGRVGAHRFPTKRPKGHFAPVCVSLETRSREEK